MWRKHTISLGELKWNMIMGKQQQEVEILLIVVARLKGEGRLILDDYRAIPNDSYEN